ncbi:hypothetical protein [Amycolatopsis sp. WAC 01376]|uniref:hypothetical protein n=1 Tax=Amycolatopsis sp. WAC 01376 TaxID=2203195 RepID=UPI0013156589|nr:hypothetical protein [Amycolatopsis sp. WAC 01376]
MLFFLCWLVFAIFMIGLCIDLIIHFAGAFLLIAAVIVAVLVLYLVLRKSRR